MVAPTQSGSASNHLITHAVLVFAYRCQEQAPQTRLSSQKHTEIITCTERAQPSGREGRHLLPPAALLVPVCQGGAAGQSHAEEGKGLDEK